MSDLRTPDRPTTHASLWRALLIIVYLTCLLIGIGLLGMLSLAWTTFAKSDLGHFTAEIGKAILAAGILGFVYELVVREASRRDEQALISFLREQFSVDLLHSAKQLQFEVARTPLQLDASVDLLAEDRRTDVVRKIFSDRIGSTDIAEAVLRTVQSAVGDKASIWRETKHTIEFHDAPDLAEFNLLRITDRVSYRTKALNRTFRVGLLRERDVYKTITEGVALDAFWLSPRAFVGEDSQTRCLLDFSNFHISTSKGAAVLEAVETILEDGSRLKEYTLPADIVGEDALFQYQFTIVADENGPYLHLALPTPSLGLEVLARNYIGRFKEFQDRVFVPDTSAVIREKIGEDVLEIRTGQVVLRGHGMVLLLR